MITFSSLATRFRSVFSPAELPGVEERAVDVASAAWHAQHADRAAKRRAANRPWVNGK